MKPTPLQWQMKIPKVMIKATADICPPSQQVEEEMEWPEEEPTLLPSGVCIPLQGHRLVYETYVVGTYDTW